MKPHIYRINEIFRSIQGEMPFQGRRAVFVRFSGCNLRCSYCDTKHNEYLNMTANEIWKWIDRIDRKVKNIIITGGEPLLQDLTEFIDIIPGDWHIQIETNGTFDINMNPDKVDIVISPKIGFLNYDVLKELNEDGYFKFVIDNESDIKFFNNLIDRFDLKKIYFMPEVKNKKDYPAKMRWLWEHESDFHPRANLGNRLQIALYGNKRGI